MLRVTGGGLRSTIDDALKRSPLPRLALRLRVAPGIGFSLHVSLFESQGKRTKNNVVLYKCVLHIAGKQLFDPVDID